MSYDSLKRPTITPNDVDNFKLGLKSIIRNLQERFLLIIKHESLTR